MMIDVTEYAMATKRRGSHAHRRGANKRLGELLNIMREKIASDAMDIIGDSLRSSKSIAKRKNKTYALRLSGVIFTIFIILSFLLFLMGWLGYVYLILIIVTDLSISYFSFRLLQSDTIEEGRVQIRRLYLTWGMFVTIFIFTNLI